MDIGIIGAGPGGLVAGVLLAKDGFDVTIYEKEDRVGGRNGALEAEGYRFDLGPTFFMMPFILEEVFTECNRNLQDYVDVELLDPYYKLVFGDGEEFTPSKDWDAVKDSLAQIDASAPEGFESYIKDNREKMKKVLPVLQKGYNSWSDLLSPEIFNVLPYMRPFTSVWDDLGKHFSNDKLKIAFTFQSKYLGMSPHTCPSIFSILSFTEYEWGVYYVKGGLNKLSKALAELFEELGGNLVLNTAVDEILLEDGAAEGLKLEDGSEEEYDELVMNSDFAWSMKNLVPEAKRDKYSNRNLAEKKYSCSTFMMYLGLDKLYENLEHHNLFIADDYERNFREIETEKVLSDDPSFYVQNPSITDDTLAPEGHSTLYLLVPVPNLKADIDWDEVEDEFRELMINKLEERAGLEDLEEHIEYEKIINPRDWKEDKAVGYGACFNLAHTLSQMLIFRPHNKFESFDNMWLVGGGTNPGSGLPTIYESGRIAAQGISEKYYEDSDLKHNSGLEDSEIIKV